MEDDDFINVISRRYGGVDRDAMAAVLCPLWIPIRSLNKVIEKLPGQKHWRAGFTLTVTDENREVMVRGCTGKFVSNDFIMGEAPWGEIAKGRIVDVDLAQGVAWGEVYCGNSSKTSLQQALARLSEGDYLEIDRYGASPKILSALTEYHFARQAREAGFSVLRMPEDTARHLGAYYNYDFQVTKGGVSKKVEAKSLWGTDTRYARLIHSTTTRPKEPESEWTAEQRRNYYPTSSCKFSTQDIFVVSLFLRTGDVRDFAYARSVPVDIKAYGLPCSSKYPEHVHQNPPCEVGDGVWFGSLAEAWDLD